MPPETENSDSLADTPVTEEHLARVAEAFDRERPNLLKWLLRKAPRADAEDILSSAFTQLLEQRHSRISRLTEYIRRSVKNLLINYYRDRAVRCNKSVYLEPEKAKTAPSPEPLVIEQQFKDLLEREVGRLEPDRRLALQLHLYEDLSTEEIVDRFALRGIRIVERTVQRYLQVSIESCRQAIETSEEPKEERSE